jgi:nucleoside-diphosphate-sugar epimerase
LAVGALLNGKVKGFSDPEVILAAESGLHASLRRRSEMPEKRSLVIVTGSNGFIGRAVCEAFVSDGFEVVGLDRPDSAPGQQGVTAIPCDVTSENSVADAVNRVVRDFEQTISSVIHLAAYYDFSGEPSPLYEQVNEQGTERLLRLLRTAPAEQFVFSSTMLVHAPCKPGEHISEDWPVDPKWDYPQSKLATESLIHAEHARTPAVILRMAGVYSDRCESLPLAHQMQRIYERRLTAKVFPGDISTGQSFVHLEDLIEAFRAAVARRAELPREAVMLIGEPDPMSYDELQRAFAAHIHAEPDWDTTQIPKAVAQAGAWVQGQIPGLEEPFIKPWMIDLADDHYALDITRAHRLLGWSPGHTLRDTLPWMATALKDDPEAFYRNNKLEGTPPKRENTTGTRGAPAGQRT